MEQFDPNNEQLPLPKPPETIVIDSGDAKQTEYTFSNELISADIIKLAEENRNRIQLERARAELTQKDEKEKTPEDVLIQLARDTEQYMSGPIDAVLDGSFGDPDHKLVIENGCVVLVRHAHDSSHLLKDGKEATPEEMRDSSLFNSGAPDSGALHTSADIQNVTYGYSHYPIYGEFRIPVAEFLELGKKGKVIIGNLGESEIVISGDVAERYLTKTVEKMKVN